MEERLKEFRRRVSTNTNPGKVVDPGPESKGGKLAPETLSFYPKAPAYTEHVPRHEKYSGGLDETDDLNMNFRDKIHLPDAVRQFLAETLGTFLLVLFGDGAIAQKIGMGETNFLHIAFGYGFALMIGILVSGGVSGGHLNPAVTLTMAVLKKCKWIQVPIYMAGQYLGAFLASAVLYGVYADMITFQTGDGDKAFGFAGIFASYPVTAANSTGNIVVVPSTATLFFDQLVGTALLLIIILAATDEKNMKVPAGLVSLYIGLGLTAIHLSFAYNAGCAINPARDFSPRLFTLMAGWKEATFNTADYFFWIPWLVPHIGGVVGGILYTVMVEGHHPDNVD